MKKISIVSGLSIALAAVLLGWLLLSTFGVAGDFLAWDSRQSDLIWKIIAVIIIGVGAYQAYKIVRGDLEPTTGSIGLIWLCLVTAVMCATGFKGTGGDIKQRITYLNLDGTISDTSVLFNCYDGFYHFSSDTALKNYVRKYNELPGRNRWNSYILRGKIAGSDAPRRNEDFEWHTGSYEGKIPKDCGK